MTAGFADMIKLSEHDYQACKAMEAHFPDEFAVRTALYHLQQAVEKSLKAFILYNGEFPAFTHDIDKLAEHCKKLGETFSDNLELIADSLTLWELKSRYDPYITFSQKKYDTAKLLYEEIHAKLVLAMNQNFKETEEETEEQSFGMTME